MNDLAFTKQKDELVFALKNVCQVRENQIVLQNIDLEIAQGSITALVGPSGAGKTSLLRLLNRLDEAAGGEIFYRSRPISEYPVRELRHRVGFVFQTPVMFPGTVRENLLTALKFTEKSAADSDQLSDDALAELDPALAERDGSRLSVGQKQRVNIARALVTAPEVLLMDEPTSALDAETADRLMETVRRLGREKRITIVMITHRLTEAHRVSDKTIVMEAGRVTTTGATEFVFGRTTDSRVRRFLDGGK